MSDCLSIPHDWFLITAASVLGHICAFRLAGFPVDGTGANEYEGVSGSRDQAEERGLVDTVDVTEAEFWGDAELVD